LGLTWRRSRECQPAARGRDGAARDDADDFVVDGEGACAGGGKLELGGDGGVDFEDAGVVEGDLALIAGGVIGEGEIGEEGGGEDLRRGGGGGGRGGAGDFQEDAAADLEFGGGRAGVGVAPPDVVGAVGFGGEGEADEVVGGEICMSLKGTRVRLAVVTRRSEPSGFWAPLA